ncbi:unnamed protein product [Pedinophyceae sp. YPF-701]|nr:unnamed protein product [Pedinophyceae sp. YPF-701]
MQASGLYLELVDEQGSYIETVESGGKVYAIGRPGKSFQVECGLLDGTTGGPWVVHFLGDNWRKTTFQGFLTHTTAADAAGTRQYTYNSFEFAAAVDGEGRNGGSEAGQPDNAGLVEVSVYKAETYPCPLVHGGQHCPKCSKSTDYTKPVLTARKGNGGPEKKFFQKPSLGVKAGVSKQASGTRHARHVHSRSVGEPVVLRIQCETRSCLELRGILERPPPAPRAVARNTTGRAVGEDVKPVIYILD